MVALYQSALGEDDDNGGTDAYFGGTEAEQAEGSSVGGDRGRGMGGDRDREGVDTGTDKDRRDRESSSRESRESRDSRDNSDGYIRGRDTDRDRRRDMSMMGGDRDSIDRGDLETQYIPSMGLESLLVSAGNTRPLSPPDYVHAFALFPDLAQACRGKVASHYCTLLRTCLGGG
ncbi:hypothetical protein B484DRAFT_406954, partial [Ochromonadaceae sp. CCMP2298]